MTDDGAVPSTVMLVTIHVPLASLPPGSTRETRTKRSVTHRYEMSSFVLCPAGRRRRGDGGTSQRKRDEGEIDEGNEDTS
jgi:hypothetical protein